MKQMNFIRKTLVTTGCQLYNTFFHPKFYASVLLVLMAVFIRIKPFAEAANDYNINVNFGIYSMIYSDPLFISVLFISLLLIFSELPFKNAQQIFLLTRSGRRAWCVSQIFYIAVISLFITLFAMLFTMLLLAGNLTFDNSWDKVIISAANHKLPAEYEIVCYASPETLAVFTPYKAILWSSLCGILCSITFGLIIFTANLACGTNIGVVFGSVLISAYWLFLNTDKYFLIWFSPLEWASVDTINLKHNSQMPTPEFAVSALFAICTISVIIILFCSRKGSKKF